MAKKPSEVTARYIFETMEYGTVNESLDLAEAWFEKTEMKLSNTDDIKEVIDKSEKQSKIWQKTPALMKAKLLNKLASEIETNSTLLGQIELKSRNILIKDTKNKSIPIFVDYLKYYAGWAATINNKNFSNSKPYGVCASLISADTPLSIFAAILAPALATGNTIIFGVSSKFIPVAYYLLELCKKTGFPDETITFVEINDPGKFLNGRFKKIAFVGNLFDRKFSEIGITFNADITSLHLGKSMSIVFDSADLDSACDTIIDNCWRYGGQFPCGINQIFVQENIYTDFVNRIKSRIEKLNVAYQNNKIPDKTCDIIIKKQIFKANDMIDVVNKVPLQLGHTNFGNDIIFEENANDILSIVAFRTANEAMQLANNSKFGLACSVWTENINLANEITNKLKTGLIWINAHGNINANASFSPFKGSGNGHFGGKDGLLEYLTNISPINYKHEFEEPSTLMYHSGGFKKSENGFESDKKEVRNCVESAKKSYESWNKVEPKIRAQCLSKLADLSSSMKIKESTLIEKWIECLYEWSTILNNTESYFQSNPNLRVIKESLGVIVIDAFYDPDYTCLQLIAAAIAYGNAVIVVNNSAIMKEFLENLCKIHISSGIPAGIFNVFFDGDTNIISKTLHYHREIPTYFTSFEISLYKKFVHISKVQRIDNVDSYKNILRIVTKNKLIWTSVGESFL